MNEYIGVILWQRQEEKFIELINRYGDPNLSVVSVDLFNIKEKDEFVDGIYNPEPVPSDNIKKRCPFPVVLITIEDKAPKHEIRKTGQGDVYVNLGSYNLKQYLRQFFSYQYIHTTDDLEQYYIILYFLSKIFGNDHLKNNHNILHDIYHSFEPTNCHALAFPKSNLDADNFSKSYIDLTTWPKHQPKVGPGNERGLPQLFVNADNIKCGKIQPKLYEHLDPPAPPCDVAQQEFNHTWRGSYFENEIYDIDDLPVTSFINGNKKPYIDYMKDEGYHTVDGFKKLINEFDHKNYNSCTGSKIVHLQGFILYDKDTDPKFEMTAEEKDVNDRIKDGYVRYCLCTRIRYLKVYDKIELFPLDGLHRIALLKSRAKQGLCSNLVRSWVSPIQPDRMYYINRHFRAYVCLNGGVQNKEKFLEHLDLLHKLKKNFYINNVYIDVNKTMLKHSIVKKIIQYRFKFIKRREGLAPGARGTNERAKFKLDIKKDMFNFIKTEHPNLKNDNIHVLQYRADCTISEDTIKNYIETIPESTGNNIFKSKIWIANYDLIKPFYINDFAYFCHIDDALKLAKHKEYNSWNHGISHIREYIQPFLSHYPILSAYMGNNLYIPKWAKNADAGFKINFIENIYQHYQKDEFSNKFINELIESKSYQKLLKTWYTIVNDYFHVFGKNQIVWHDHREELHFKYNKSFDSDGLIDGQEIWHIMRSQYPTTCFMDNNLTKIQNIEWSKLENEL